MRITNSTIQTLATEAKQHYDMRVVEKCIAEKQYLCFYWGIPDAKKSTEAMTQVDKFSTGHRLTTTGTYGCTIVMNPVDTVVITGFENISVAAYVAGINNVALGVPKIVQNNKRAEASFLFEDGETAMQFRLMVNG